MLALNFLPASQQPVFFFDSLLHVWHVGLGFAVMEAVGAYASNSSPVVKIQYPKTVSEHLSAEPPLIEVLALQMEIGVFENSSDLVGTCENTNIMLAIFHCSKCKRNSKV